MTRELATDGASVADLQQTGGWKSRRRSSTWCTPGEVHARVAGRQLDAARDAGGRLAAVVAPRSGVDSAPQCPPAGRSAAPGRPIGRRISLERRSGGVSRGRRRLHRSVRGVIDAPNSAHVARHQRLDVPLPACLDRSGGAASRLSAGPRRRPGTPGHPPPPPGTPAQFPDPHSRGGTHRYPRPCVQEFHRKDSGGKRNLKMIAAHVRRLREQHPDLPAEWRVQQALRKGADRLNAAAGDLLGSHEDLEAMNDTETGDLFNGQPAPRCAGCGTTEGPVILRALRAGLDPRYGFACDACADQPISGTRQGG